MKNKLIIFFLFFLSCKELFAENIFIEAKNISLDKDKTTSIFENEVVVKTQNKIIKSDFAKYNKKSGFLVFKKNVVAIDEKNNIIESDHAEYYEKNKLFKSIGPTKLTTAQNYILEGEDIIANNSSKFIKSDKKAVVSDQDGNKIFLDNFQYQNDTNIFKSIGSIKIKDKMKNNYEFSQIYIDTKKKEILGTDAKAFLNQEDFKFSQNHKPRIFSNSTQINNEKSTFNKSVFTSCAYRENDKCPPWSIQASEMLHDNKKKTIYYENAIVKIYDIPIFYFPILSHPDPTVDRRSGFLPPTLSDSQNLGSGITIPYFFAINGDKNFILDSKIFASENPLFKGEYHQAFKNSILLADFGFTEGYKKTSSTKKGGEKSHFFSNYVKQFKGKNNSDNTFSLSVQDVSNDKYLKLYKIKSNLIDFNKDTLENTLDFTHENEDYFFGLNASIYETLKTDYNDKYEYILPEINIDKNIFDDDKLGNLNLQTNFKVHSYDTNKHTKFLINDFNWNSRNKYFQSGFQSKFLGNIKNINYEAKNVEFYKEDTTNEIYGALGLLTDLKLQKERNNTKHLLTPKLLLRFSPGEMRKEIDGPRLNPINAFSLDRLDSTNNFETGLTSTVGVDYNINNNNQNLDFSLAQIISEKENKKMPDKTSLNEKVSDLVGSASFDINKNINLNYNFSLDQNYSDLNYNEIGTKIDLGMINFDFNYLQEKKHIGDQEYFNTKLNLRNKNDGVFSFETKRNLVTNSAEFYNLSYEYLNDCLRAGLVYRREFYNDSELEPENSLLFKVTLTPFGSIHSPTFK